MLHCNTDNTKFLGVFIREAKKTTTRKFSIKKYAHDMRFSENYYYKRYLLLSLFFLTCIWPIQAKIPEFVFLLHYKQQNVLSSRFINQQRRTTVYIIEAIGFIYLLVCIHSFISRFL